MTEVEKPIILNPIEIDDDEPSVEYGPFKVGIVALALSAFILLVLGLTKNCVLFWAILVLGIIMTLFLIILGKDKPAAMSVFSSTLIVFLVAMSLYLGKVC